MNVHVGPGNWHAPLHEIKTQRHKEKRITSAKPEPVEKPNSKSTSSLPITAREKRLYSLFIQNYISSILLLPILYTFDTKMDGGS